jgi:atypical dual specificity phosphatase
MKPANFSFLLPGRLAGMARPGSAGDLRRELDFLHGAEIRALVSLNEFPPDPRVVREAGIEPRHIPVPDFQTPTPDQAEDFVAFVDAKLAEGKPVAVHCTAGQGRTGTLLACYLVARGKEPGEAVETVRLLRPGSVETMEQERFVHDFAARRGRG